MPSSARVAWLARRISSATSMTVSSRTMPTDAGASMPMPAPAVGSARPVTHAP
jgi:hypothetical protein